MSENSTRCYACGKPADKLCDGIISVAIIAGIDDPDAIRTCDRAMCPDHVFHTEGPLFVCGCDGCEVDSTDFCEQCYTKQVHHVKWGRHASRNSLIEVSQ